MKRWIAIAVTLLSLALAGARPGAAAEFGGTWRLLPNTPPANANQKPRPAILKLKQDGEKLTGTLVTPQGKEVPINDPTVKGNERQLKVILEQDGASITATLRPAPEREALT